MGARRCRAAEAQRLPDAADGRRGGAGRERRRGRSRTRSTRRCATGRRASPTPIICSARSRARIPSRLMVREYQRVIGKEARAQIIEEEGAAARRGASPASAAARTRSACSPISSTTRGAADRGRGGGQGPRRRRAWRDPAARPAGHPPRRRDLCAAGRGRADRRTAGRSRPGSIIPRVGPEHAFLKDSGRADLCRRDRPRGARRLRLARALRRHHLRLRIAPMRWRTR